MISPRTIIIAALVALLAVAVIIGITISNKRAEDARQAGAAIQREDNQAAIIERTEQANEARDQIRNDTGDARYQQCLRTARTPQNCQRLLPERETDNR